MNTVMTSKPIKFRVGMMLMGSKEWPYIVEEAFADPTIACYARNVMEDVRLTVVSSSNIIAGYY